MSNVAINIAAEFTGKKAFDKAGKAVVGLEKSAQKLARTLGIGLSTAAIVAYGKASVRAFADDQAAAQRLATAVDNLGLSFSKAKVEDFISQTERSAGILDDKLRPAMQALLTTTGSLTKSQELLNNAITISRASGIDLATVSQDLANGYVGITRGLKKYNTGLTQAELKSKSFSDVLGLLLTRSAGAADAYLSTTAYKLDVLSVASENAKETIGKGLVDAFALMGGGSSAADAADTFDSIAKAIAGITTAAGAGIGALVKLYKALDFITSFGGITGANGKLAQMSAPKVNTNRSSSPAGTWKRTAQQRAAEAEAQKRAKELAALQAKQVKSQKALTAEQKKQAALKKAGTIFDLDQIQIIAALKGKLSEEDRKRVELQLALLTENTSEATKLTYEIAKAQGLGEQMARNLASLPAAKNPFEAWAAYLDMIAAKAAAIATGGGSAGVPAMPIVPPSTNGQGLDFGGNALGSPVPNFTPPPAGTYGSSSGAGAIVVQIDGKTIASALLDQSLSGNQAYVNRRTGGFE